MIGNKDEHYVECNRMEYWILKCCRGLKAPCTNKPKLCLLSCPPNEQRERQDKKMQSVTPSLDIFQSPQQSCRDDSTDKAYHRVLPPLHASPMSNSILRGTAYFTQGPITRFASCLLALQSLAHLGIQIISNHMFCFPCLLIEDLAPFFRSVRRSIH